MTLPPPASEFYQSQQRLIVATLGLTRSLWRLMDPADMDRSFASVSGRLVQVVTSAQLGAARNGSAYVGPTLDVLGQSAAADALVRPQGFAGIASDGRSIVTLLEGAKIRAKRAQSLDAGGAWLDMAVHTQVQDAGRMAASVDSFTRPGVGWVRAVNPPCCQRCAVLAGKYSAPTAFARHPRCDCFAVPTTDPRSLTMTEVEPGQVKDLTAAQRKAIADGGDMGRVINSHRAGKRSKDGMTTTELAKRGRQRLTPEAIYRVAATRDEALRRLRENGYLI